MIVKFPSLLIIDHNGDNTVRPSWKIKITVTANVYWALTVLSGVNREAFFFFFKHFPFCVLDKPWNHLQESYEVIPEVSKSLYATHQSTEWTVFGP